MNTTVTLMSNSPPTITNLAQLAQAHYDALLAANLAPDVALKAVMYWLFDDMLLWVSPSYREVTVEEFSMMAACSCADFLSGAFIWSQSPEGFSFWDSVHKELKSELL